MKRLTKYSEMSETGQISNPSVLTLTCLSDDSFLMYQNPCKPHFREELPTVCTQQFEKLLKCAVLSKIHDIQPTGADKTSASKNSLLALEESQILGVSQPRETSDFSKIRQSNTGG